MKKIIVLIITIIIFIGVGILVLNNESLQKAMFLHYGKEMDIDISQKHFTKNDTAVYRKVEYSIVDINTHNGDRNNIPKQGYEFIEVTLNIENKSNNTTSFCSMYWDMSGKAPNKMFRENFMIGYFFDSDMGFETTNIAPKQSIQKTLIYEQPIGAQEVELYFYKYLPQSNSIDLPVITFKIEQ